MSLAKRHHTCPPPAAVSALPDNQLIDYLRSLGGIRDEVLNAPDLLALLLPIIRADLTMFDTHVYREGPALPCPLRALHGRDDSSATRAGVLAWAEHSRGGFRFESFPGDHFFVIEHAGIVVGWVQHDMRNTAANAREGKRPQSRVP
jgi:surfactin synthase thioesterase subunit